MIGLVSAALVVLFIAKWLPMIDAATDGQRPALDQDADYVRVPRRFQS